MSGRKRLGGPGEEGMGNGEGVRGRRGETVGRGEGMGGGHGMMGRGDGTVEAGAKGAVGGMRLLRAREPRLGMRAAMRRSGPVVEGVRGDGAHGTRGMAVVLEVGVRLHRPTCATRWLRGTGVGVLMWAGRAVG